MSVTKRITPVYYPKLCTIKIERNKEIKKVLKGLIRTIKKVYFKSWSIKPRVFYGKTIKITRV